MRELVAAVVSFCIAVPVCFLSGFGPLPTVLFTAAVFCVCLAAAAAWEARA